MSPTAVQQLQKHKLDITKIIEIIEKQDSLSTSTKHCEDNLFYTASFVP